MSRVSISRNSFQIFARPRHKAGEEEKEEDKSGINGNVGNALVKLSANPPTPVQWISQVKLIGDHD